MIHHEEKLAGVHPKLAEAIRQAADKLPFELLIVQGLRTDEECYTNYGKGRNALQCTLAGCPAKYAQPKLSKVTWLKKPLGSKHCRQKDGYGHAVDVAPHPYNPNEPLARFKVIAIAVGLAAKASGSMILWGGSWASSPDIPHFEYVGETNA